MRAHWMNEGEGLIRFHCPGCGHSHWVRVNGTHPWGWNGSLELPTFTPSVLVRGGHMSLEVCHSFVTEGRIQYLSDSTHALAGRTVDLPEAE